MDKEKVLIAIGTLAIEALFSLELLGITISGLVSYFFLSSAFKIASNRSSTYADTTMAVGYCFLGAFTLLLTGAGIAALF